MCKYLKLTNERNYILFMLGIYSGLRVSDILALRVRDVKGKTHFLIKENKTGKTQKLLISDELKKELKWYLADKKDTDYLIRSRQSDRTGKQKPVTRDRALKIIKKAAEELEEDNIGCHSMLKPSAAIITKAPATLPHCKRFSTILRQEKH